jgi:hypothetical protein
LHITSAKSHSPSCLGCLLLGPLVLLLLAQQPLR